MFFEDLMPAKTMQPLKLEDLNAQFDSIVRRYRDGGLIAYRDAHYFMNDMLNLFERIERLRLFVNNDGAKNIMAVAVQESPRHERRTGKMGENVVKIVGKTDKISYFKVG